MHVVSRKKTEGWGGGGGGGGAVLLRESHCRTRSSLLPSITRTSGSDQYGQAADVKPRMKPIVLPKISSLPSQRLLSLHPKSTLRLALEVNVMPFIL